jgi:hypothetical protein
MIISAEPYLSSRTIPKIDLISALPIPEVPYIEVNVSLIKINMGSTLNQNSTDYSHLPKTEFRTNLETKPKSKDFPDGIKTTGQQPPPYEEIRPYADFPKVITGPTAWTKDQYSGSPEKEALRKRSFTEEELEELSIAADLYLANGRSLTEMSKV